MAKNSFTPLQYSYHNWTQQAFISPKAFPPLEQRCFSGKAKPVTLQPTEDIEGAPVSDNMAGLLQKTVQL